MPAQARRTLRSILGPLCLLVLLAMVPAVHASPALPSATSVGANPVSLVVDEPAGHVFVLSQGNPDLTKPGARFEKTMAGTLSMLSASTGALLRTVPAGHVGNSADPTTTSTQAMAVDRRTGRVFVLNGSTLDSTGRALLPGRVRVFDAATGALLRTVAVGIQPVAVAVDERTARAFVASTAPAGAPKPAGVVTVLDAGTGLVLRTVGVGIKPRAVAVDERTGRVFVANLGNGCAQPSGDPRCRSSAVTILDATTGRVLSAIPMQRSCAVAVAEPPGRVFADNIVLGRGNQPVPHEMDLLDATSGARLRTMRLNTACTTQQLAADTAGTRAFLATGRTVSVLDARTGTLLRSIAAPAGYLMYDQRRTRVYAVDPNYQFNPDGSVVTPQPRGLLRVLDATSGALRHTVAVGTVPIAVGLDGNTDRLFVLNQGDHTVSVLDTAAL